MFVVKRIDFLSGKTTLAKQLFKIFKREGSKRSILLKVFLRLFREIVVPNSCQVLKYPMRFKALIGWETKAQIA
jgi:hypothetical protein